MESKVPASFVCVVRKVDVGGLGKEWAWIFRKWVKCQTIDDYGKNLRFVSLGPKWFVLNSHMRKEHQKRLR